MDIETTQWYLDQWGIYQKNLPGVTLGVQAHAYITAVNGDRWCDIDAEVFAQIDNAVCALRRVSDTWTDLIKKRYVFDFNYVMLATWLSRQRKQPVSKQRVSEEMKTAVACLSGMLFEKNIDQRHLTVRTEIVSLQLP